MKDKAGALAPKWEYNKLAIAKDSLATLNELGSEGWELIGFDAFCSAVFKRPVIQENNAK